jgi:hypothetical protein
MKKGVTVISAIIFSFFLFASCNSTSKNVDVCKCLSSPGDSEFMKENGDACRDAISKEIGVDNWEKVNFSQNKALSKKFDELANRCR